MQVISAIITLCRCTWSWKKMEQRSMMRSISRRCLTTPCSCFFSCRCASKERKWDLYSIYCHCKFKTVVKVYSSWIRFRGEWNIKERQFSKLWSPTRSSFCTNTNNDFQQMWFSCKAFCHYFAKAGLRPVRPRLVRLGQNTVLGCSQRLALGLWRSTLLKWSFFVTRVFRHSQGRIKNYLQAVVIFRDTHFSSFTGGPNWAFRCLDCGINNWKTDSKSKVYRPQFWRKKCKSWVSSN